MFLGKIGKLYYIGHTTCQSCIAFHHALDVVGVACHDYNKVTTVVFHFRNEGIQRFTTVIFGVVVAAVQRVRLVDKQYRPVRRAAQTKGFGRRFADVTSAEVTPRLLVELPYPQYAAFLQYLADDTRYCRLARTGVAHKAHMQCRLTQRRRFACKLDLRHNLQHTLLYLFRADKLVQHFHTAHIVEQLPTAQTIAVFLSDNAVGNAALRIGQLLAIQHFRNHFAYGVYAVKLAVTAFLAHTAEEAVPRLFVHAKAVLAHFHVGIATDFLVGKGRKGQLADKHKVV